jgi:hypothetical protein
MVSGSTEDAGPNSSSILPPHHLHLCAITIAIRTETETTIATQTMIGIGTATEIAITSELKMATTGEGEKKPCSSPAPLKMEDASTARAISREKPR